MGTNLNFCLSLCPDFLICGLFSGAHLHFWQLPRYLSVTQPTNRNSFVPKRFTTGYHFSFCSFIPSFVESQQSRPARSKHQNGYLRSCHLANCIARTRPSFSLFKYSALPSLLAIVRCDLPRPLDSLVERLPGISSSNRRNELAATQPLDENHTVVCALVPPSFVVLNHRDTISLSPSPTVSTSALLICPSLLSITICIAC